LGGSLGDRFGRRRLFLLGVVWFAVASLGCANAPSAGALIGARALQGVGGALLTPGSLAILEATFDEKDRAAAIGVWSGFAGIAIAVGPFLGGWLIQSVSWRLIFLINVPVAIAVVIVGLRHVPETKDNRAVGRIDIAGTGTGAVALAGIIYALTRGPAVGWAGGLVIASGAIGVVSLATFVTIEHRTANPILPLKLFGSSQFRAANLVTFLVYGPLGCALFLLPIQLQRVLNYSPIAAGSCLLPITVVMLVLSARMGRLATRIGPRVPMTIGPVVSGLGLLVLSQVGQGSGQLLVVLSGTTVLALGLATTVAPLTATVLAAVPSEHAGVASAINTDVARIGQLVFVALVPVVAGISNGAFSDTAAFSSGFATSMTILATVLGLGGLLAFVGVRKPLATKVGLNESTMSMSNSAR